MSRRRGEFEHRTSIFEGAFRAWCFLGQLSPEELFSKEADDFNPLIACDGDGNPLPTVDGRSSAGDDYRYEPLPRTGLAHPFCKAILSPWLGPDVDSEAMDLGLTTLRTWWQHRRRGESGTAINALGTDRMRSVVDGKFFWCDDGGSLACFKCVNERFCAKFKGRCFEWNTIFS